jgi:hypothetical protein
LLANSVKPKEHACQTDTQQNAGNHEQDDHQYDISGRLGILFRHCSDPAMLRETRLKPRDHMMFVACAQSYNTWRQIAVPHRPTRPRKPAAVMLIGGWPPGGFCRPIKSG